MKKSLLLIVVVLFISSMILINVGCKEEAAPVEEVAEEAVEEAEPTEEVAEEAVEEAEPTEEDLAESRKAYAGTTLNVLLKVGYETEAIIRFVENFEELTGINVEYEVYDEPTLRNKISLDSTAKTGTYDVIATQFWYMPEYIRAGWLEPLNNYETDKEWYALDNVPEGLLGTFSDLSGNLYSVPVSASGGVLIYRTDLLEKHGLNPPQTTKEILTVAAELKEKEPDIYPFIGRGDSSAASFATSAGWAWAYGARVLDEELNVIADTPEMKEAMTDYVELVQKYGPEDQASIGWEMMSEIFRQGNVAMNFEMSGFPGVYNNPEVSSVAGKIDVTLIKGPADNYAQWMYAEGLGISSFSKNKEAAWLFLQWRSSLEVALLEVADGIRFDFPDSRVAQDPAYVEKSAGNEFITQKLPDILASVDSSYWPAVPEFDQVSEAFQREISLVIAGDQTIDEALANAQKGIEEIIAASGK